MRTENSSPRSGLSHWLRPGALASLAPADAVLPLPRRLTPADRLRRAAIWLGLLLALGLLFRFDVTLMRWRFALIHDEPSGLLQQILFGLRDFGQIVPITLAVVVVFLTDRRRKVFIFTLLLALLLELLASQPAKWCFPRYRPRTAIEEVAQPRVLAEQPPASPAAGDGGAQPDRKIDAAVALARLEPGDTWMRPDLNLSRQSVKYESFPSGHSGAAFAFAAVLAWFYPHLRRVFWTLAVGCAASRVVDAVHWPSDCLAGAVIGYAAAWMALRPYVWARPVVFLRRRLGRIRR